MVAIYVFLFTNNVGYRFPNSTLSPQERAKLIAWVGRPVEFIRSAVASIDAIAWGEAQDGTYRFDESLFFRKAADGSILNDKDGNVVRMSEDEIAAYKNLKFGEFRRQWSNFLVGCVLVWLITPRVLICAVSGTCMACFYRDLLPDSKNERVRKIVAHVVGAGEHKVSHTPSPSVPVPSLPGRRPIKPSQPLASPEPTLPTFSDEICRKPFVGDQSSGKVSESGAAERDAKEGDSLLVSHTEEPSSKREPGSVSTPARTTGRDFRIVGYELDDPSFRRLFILARLLKASINEPKSYHRNRRAEGQDGQSTS